MKKNGATILFFTVLSGFLFYANILLARTDLSIAENDITFSKANPLDGETVRIYARVFNAGDNDVTGYVIFLGNGKEIADHQQISLKPNTYDDVFIDWKVKSGTYNVEAKISGLNSIDDNTGNNGVIKKDFFVDLDTDKDGVGDTKDPDKDNDGLTNEEEISAGTNPLVADTDNDQVNDKVDIFPLDKSEWRDTDNDTIGDNKDTDADGDGLTNKDEITNFGSNPLSPDSDNDGLNDKQEVEAKTSPNKADTDEDGVKDIEDKYPLDASMTTASLMDSVRGLFKGNNAIYVILGIIITIIFIFLLFRRKRS